MNLMDAILNSGGSPVSQISRKLGIGQEDVTTAIAGLLPALTNGIKKNVSQQGGIESLLGALNRSGHERYLEDPEAISREDAVSDGNGILSHLLGSKDVSRQLGDRTSKNTGLGSDILKKVLPLAAGLAMGALSKQGNRSGVLSGLKESRSSSGLGSLVSLLDADGDGSPIDDILGIAGKLF
ncbi:MAG: DUF937 domain-containing protein [Candidatus Aminicenantes bacterium]|jgi:hypothetical protein